MAGAARRFRPSGISESPQVRPVSAVANRKNAIHSNSHAMPLTPEQRAELDGLGPADVRIKRMGARPGDAVVPGFQTGAPGGLGGILQRSTRQ